MRVATHPSPRCRLAPHLAPRLRSCSAPSPAVFRSSARNNSMATVAGALGRLQMERSALFVCDVQERFRPVIADMPAVIDTTARMVGTPGSGALFWRGNLVDVAVTSVEYLSVVTVLVGRDRWVAYGTTPHSLEVPTCFPYTLHIVRMFWRLA